MGERTVGQEACVAVTTCTAAAVALASVCASAEEGEEAGCVERGGRGGAC